MLAEQDEAVVALWLSEVAAALFVTAVVGRDSLAWQSWAVSHYCSPAPMCLLSSAICLLYPCLELTLLEEGAVQINLDATRGLLIIKDWGVHWKGAKSALSDCKNSKNSLCKKWLEHAVWQMCSFCSWNLSIEWLKNHEYLKSVEKS